MPGRRPTGEWAPKLEVLIVRSFLWSPPLWGCSPHIGPRVLHRSCTDLSDRDLLPGVRGWHRNSTTGAHKPEPSYSPGESTRSRRQTACPATGFSVAANENASPTVPVEPRSARVITPVSRGRRLVHGSQRRKVRHRCLALEPADPAASWAPSIRTGPSERRTQLLVAGLSLRSLHGWPEAARSRGGVACRPSSGEPQRSNFRAPRPFDGGQSLRAKQ